MATTTSSHDAAVPTGDGPPTVLIVGAGPTGLTLGIILARYGVAVRVIEKRARASEHTKATNIMQRTQELLDSIDLLAPLQQIGGAMSRLVVTAYGTSVGPRTMHLSETAFPDVILCGQHNFEAVAAAELARLGVNIEFGTELTGLTQDRAHDDGEDQDRCVVDVARDGVADQIRAAYVVGADGRSGTTRAFTALDFEPAATGVAIRQVDATLSWARSSTMDQMWLFYVDHGFGAVVPLPGGVHRVLMVERAQDIPNRNPTLAEMTARLREVSQDPSAELTEQRWTSYTDLSMGIAPALVDGRVILAGDAGNPVLPNGGQGMNTGIADAFNLGWKLAAVLHHGAPTALLATYNTERHALRTKLQRAQYNSLKYTTLVTPKPVQALFRLLAEPVLDAGAEYKVAQAFSELTVTTRRSPLTIPDRRRRGARAGDRARDATVVHGHDTTQLRDLLYDGGWTLLAFTGRGRHTDPARVETAAGPLRAHVATWVITTTTPNQPGSVDTLADLDGQAHRAYRITRPTLVLVRPDGHIAATLPPRHALQITDYLTLWGADPTQRFTTTPSTDPAATTRTEHTHSQRSQ